jgi:hypothetical protein
MLFISLACNAFQFKKKDKIGFTFVNTIGILHHKLKYLYRLFNGFKEWGFVIFIISV